jgi:hypothetical protein
VSERPRMRQSVASYISQPENLKPYIFANELNSLTLRLKRSKVKKGSAYRPHLINPQSAA